MIAKANFLQVWYAKIFRPPKCFPMKVMFFLFGIACNELVIKTISKFDLLIIDKCKFDFEIGTDSGYEFSKYWKLKTLLIIRSKNE